MATRAFTVAYHVAVLGGMSYGYHSLKKIASDEWASRQRGGRWQFLTIIGLAVAWFTIMLSLRAGISTKGRFFHAIKRVLLMVALPLSVTVTAVYWSLLLVAPKMIVMQMEPTEPATIETPFANPIPPLVDHSIHSLPAVALLIEFFVLEYKYSWPTVMQGGFVLVTAASAAYSLWVEYCAAGNGYYPYPFLAVDLPYRIAIYAVVTLWAYVVLLLLNALHPRSDPKDTFRVEKKAVDDDGIFSEGHWVWFNRISL